VVRGANGSRSRPAATRCEEADPVAIVLVDAIPDVGAASDGNPRGRGPAVAGVGVTKTTGCGSASAVKRRVRAASRRGGPRLTLPLDRYLRRPRPRRVRGWLRDHRAARADRDRRTRCCPPVDRA
jgi:hypothetical protein